MSLSIATRVEAQNHRLYHSLFRFIVALLSLAELLSVLSKKHLLLSEVRAPSKVASIGTKKKKLNTRPITYPVLNQCLRTYWYFILLFSNTHTESVSKKRLVLELVFEIFDTGAERVPAKSSSRLYLDSWYSMLFVLVAII